MLKLVCPNCGKVFFRGADLAQTVATCPACQARVTFDKAGKCALIKQVKYARKNWEEWERGWYKTALKLPHALRKAGYTPSKRLLAIIKDPTNWEYWEDIEDHTPEGVEAKFEDGRWVLRKWKPGMEAGTGKVIPYAREDPKHIRSYWEELKQHKVAFRTRMQWLSRIYGGRGGYTSEALYKIVTGKTVGGYYIFPFVKGAPPEVNRILERTYRTHRGAGDTKTAAAIAAWTKVKQAGYVKVTKPAPVWVKRRYNMEQLKPMRVIYTAGPRRLGKPRTEEERRKRHKKLHPVTKLPPRGTGLDYGLGTAMGGLTERGVRGLFGAIRRHPRITRGAGAFGVGYLTHKELAKRRKRKKGYQLDVSHFTPDVPLSRMERLKKRLAAKKPTGKGIARVGKRLGGTASVAIKTAILGLAAKEFLDLLARRRPRAPWMPDIRSDVELAGYENLGQVVEYASVTPSRILKTIRAKTGVALHKTKVGAERGLLMWLMGFISAELLSRGITSPRRRHEVVFPEGTKGYARLHTKGGQQIPGGVSASERLPRWGYRPFTPTATVHEPLPKFKRPVGRRLKQVAKVGILPIGALLALRVLKRRKQEGYSFRSATSKVLRGVKKVGGGAGKVLGKVYPAAMTALIISEMWPRRKQRLTHPPVQSPLTQPYGLAKGLKRLLKLRKGKTSPMVGRKLRDLTLSRKDPAMAELNKRLAAAAQKHKKHFQLVERYPFKSAAQRRWMHWKKPKMAKEWEEHTPEGKELPERVSKHLLGVPVITPLIIAAVLAKRRKAKAEAVSKHALSVPWALKRARDLMRLKGARAQGRDVVEWARRMGRTLRTAQLKTTDAKRKVELGARAGSWETIADQVGDVIGRGQLEKVGLLAAATAAGAAGHEVGKKRERARVHRVVG